MLWADKSQMLKLGDELLCSQSLLRVDLEELLDEGDEGFVLLLDVAGQLVLAFLDLFEQFYQQLLVKWQGAQQNCVKCDP